MHILIIRIVRKMHRKIDKIPIFLFSSLNVLHLFYPFYRKEWTGCVRILKRIDQSKRSPALVRVNENEKLPQLIQKKNDNQFIVLDLIQSCKQKTNTMKAPYSKCNTKSMHIVNHSQTKPHCLSMSTYHEPNDVYFYVDSISVKCKVPFCSAII